MWVEKGTNFYRNVIFFRNLEVIPEGTVPSIKKMCEELQNNKQIFYTRTVHQNEY